MHARLVLLSLILGLAACDPASHAAAAEAEPQRSTPERPLKVSIIQLVATPDRFHGEWVLATGFYRAEFEGTAVYLHREDAEHGLYSNGLWVARESREHDQRYLLIVGQFNAHAHGHMGLWSGTLEDIRRMQVWPPRQENGANND